MAEQAEKATALRILARQKFIEGALWYAERMAYEYGVKEKPDVQANHTRTEAKLENHYDFSFWHDGPSTMFGGEQVKIWYMGKLVLEVHWHDMKNCTVAHFEQDPLWQEVIKTLYEAERESQEQKRREEEEKRTSEVLARSIEKQLNEIASHASKEAQRLKLVL